MDERSIAVLDSGIGGLFTLKLLKEKYPKENFIYFADSKNLPYGSKTKKELEDIAEYNCKRLLSFGVKIIVFACNTLSVTVEDKFTAFCVPIIGVKPVAEKCGKGILLCTPKTAESEHVRKLQKTFSIDVFPQEGLAEEIEHSFCGYKIDLESRFKGVDRDYDYVSIGCTHYRFLERKLKDVFYKSRILGGENVVLTKIENNMTTANPKRKNGYVLFVGEGGKNAEKIFNKFS